MREIRTRRTIGTIRPTKTIRTIRTIQVRCTEAPAAPLDDQFLFSIILEPLNKFSDY